MWRSRQRARFGGVRSPVRARPFRQIWPRPSRSRTDTGLWRSGSAAVLQTVERGFESLQADHPSHPKGPKHSRLCARLKPGRSLVRSQPVPPRPSGAANPRSPSGRTRTWFRRAGATPPEAPALHAPSGGHSPGGATGSARGCYPRGSRFEPWSGSATMRGGLLAGQRGPEPRPRRFESYPRSHDDAGLRVVRSGCRVTPRVS